MDYAQYTSTHNSAVLVPMIEVVRAIGATGKAYILFRNPRNHEVLSTSESYATAWNRNRAIRKLVRDGGGLIREGSKDIVRLPG